MCRQNVKHPASLRPINLNNSLLRTVGRILFQGPKNPTKNVKNTLEDEIESCKKIL